MIATPPNARLTRYTAWYDLHKAIDADFTAACTICEVIPGIWKSPAVLPDARFLSKVGRDAGGKPASRTAGVTSFVK